MTNLQAEIPLADGGPTSSELLQEPAVTEDNGTTFSANSEDEESVTIERNETHGDQQFDASERSSLESRLNCSRERQKQREEGGSEMQVDVLIDKWRKKYELLQQAKYGTSSQPATSTPRRSTRVKKAPDVFAPTL